MITTNNENYWREVWEYKDHGKSFIAVSTNKDGGGFKWLHESIGTNWRMMEMQAVIGRLQLKKLPEWTRARTSNANAIMETCMQHKICKVPVFCCSPECNHEESCSDCCAHAYYKLYVYNQSDRLSTHWNRDRIIAEINTRGVPCYQGSCSEVYREIAFTSIGLQPDEAKPVAKCLGDTSLMFLVHPTLTFAEIGKTCATINEVFRLAARHSN